MNKKLLLEIFRIPAMSFQEEQMADFIKKKLNEYDVPFKQDSLGNIYNIDYSNRPLLSAHMDTVQDETDALVTDFIKIKGNYLSGYGVIGGDDKCGIYIILETLKDREMNFVFFVQEEVGASGSREWVKNRYLGHILYGLVLDRTGSGDIVCTKNDYGTKIFETFLHEVGKDFGYSPAMGTFSDADSLNELISCANLSCGYYGAHTKHEFVNLEELDNSFKYVNTVLTHVKDKFEKPDKIGYAWKQEYYSQYGDDDYSGYGITSTGVECVICGKSASTIYIESIREFICFPCIGTLKNELNDLENKIFDDAMEEEWMNGIGSF